MIWIRSLSFCFFTASEGLRVCGIWSRSPGDDNRAGARRPARRHTRPRHVPGGWQQTATVDEPYLRLVNDRLSTEENTLAAINRAAANLFPNLKLLFIVQSMLYLFFFLTHAQVKTLRQFNIYSFIKLIDSDLRRFISAVKFNPNGVIKNEGFNCWSPPQALFLLECLRFGLYQ